ncbi:MAG: SLC13 family permease [Planctomycetales bacterium]|nr:SLC13 family permease [Planctomycetales bacterium]
MAVLPRELHPFVAVAVVITTFITLMVRRRTPTDLLLVGALMLLTILGVLTPEQAFAGFSNQAVLTIAGLFGVTAALRRVGLLDWVGRLLLGRAETERGALLRLAGALLTTSAFILNTALVAMLMPVVLDWCRRRQVSPSRLLIPLSYLTILGGVCSLIGTSTTLVAQGKLREMQVAYQTQARTDRQQQFVSQLRPMSLFEVGWVGLPCAAAGALFLVTLGKRLLPDRRDMLEQLGDQRREYLVEMLVSADCQLIGKTIEEGGLRHLPGLFLIEIDRDGETITPVTPQDVVRAGDRMVFAGIVDTIIDLERIPGLIPAADMNYEFHPKKRQQRQLTEVVLSRTSPLIGRTVRDANFRQRYNAAVVAVHRNGVRLTNKIGDIQFQEGDTLVLQTRTSFVATYRNSRDFYLVSSVDDSHPPRHHKLSLAALLAAGLLIWLVVAAWFGAAGTGWSSTAVASITVAGLMVATRCVPLTEVRAALDIHTLTTIAAALGLGQALAVSGAAEQLAQGLVDAVGPNPIWLLLVVYALAVLMTEAITNNAVAAMLLPLAVAVAWQAGLNPRPFCMAVALAASLSFITPIGYQTNLMVMGPGGYRPMDYVKLGFPLALIVGAVALLLIPRVWPF